MNELVERVAKAIYAVIPNGGEVHRLTTATSQSGNAVYERAFVEDTWEEAPDRHDKCRESAHAAIASIHKFLSDYFVEDWPAVIDAALKEPKDETS